MAERLADEIKCVTIRHRETCKGVPEVVQADARQAGTRTNEFQKLTQAAMKRGFQTRDGEMDLAQLVGEINEHRTE